MNIFVGNLSFASTNADLKKLFENFGSVSSAVIVTEKKGDKSRGFGFVEMLDDAQTQVAISALDGKEFMGRVLNISQAHSKAKPAEENREEEPANNSHPAVNYLRDSAPRDSRFRTPRSGSRYKQGRRSLSYMKRKGIDKPEESSNQRQRAFNNPMRWRKNKTQLKPWQVKQEEGKVWQKPQDKPWEKKEPQVKPWQKRQFATRPWKKTEVDSAKPWKKPQTESKPWRKPLARSKPWQKSAPQSGRSSFNKIRKSRVTKK